MGYKISLKGENMKNNRRAFLCKQLIDEELVDAIYNDRLNSRIKGAEIEIER